MDPRFDARARLFGLEMQTPWADLLLRGQKTIETRSYALPEALLYRHIAVIESESGGSTLSALGDCVTLVEEGYPRIVGTVVFSECFEYETGRQWDGDRDKHLVEQGSSFGWPRRRKRRVEKKSQKNSNLKEPSGASRKVEVGKKVITPCTDLVMVEERTPIAIESNSRARLISGSSWLTTGDSRFKSSGRFDRSKSKQLFVLDQEDERSIDVPAAVTVFEASHGAEDEEKGECGDQERGEEEEDEWESEPESERKKFYGWRVLGAFRAHIPQSKVPTALRVHRSLFDCGALSLDTLSVPS